MMRIVTLASFVALSATYTVALPERVLACSAPRCEAGSVVPKGGTVPQNAVTFLWRAPGGQDAGTSSAARLYRVLADGGVGEELAFDIVGTATEQTIRPRMTLSPLDTVVFEYEDPCLRTGERFVRSTVQIAESAPVPTTLGTLRKSERKRGLIEVEVGTGECTKGFDASYVELDVELAPTARPYADLFRYDLRVDGVAARSYAAKRSDWVTRYASGAPPALPRGKDILYTFCSTELGTAGQGSAPGMHRVQMEASLPDGTRLVSDEVTVELRCDPTAGDAGTMSDAGAFDAAVVGNDAATGFNDAATSDGDAALPPSASEASSDQGCSLASDGEGSGGLFALLAFAFAFRFRKRRA